MAEAGTVHSDAPPSNAAIHVVEPIPFYIAADTCLRAPLVPDALALRFDLSERIRPSEARSRRIWLHRAAIVAKPAIGVQAVALAPTPRTGELTPATRPSASSRAARARQPLADGTSRLPSAASPPTGSAPTRSQHATYCANDLLPRRVFVQRRVATRRSIVEPPLDQRPMETVHKPC